MAVQCIVVNIVNSLQPSVIRNETAEVAFDKDTEKERQLDSIGTALITLNIGGVKCSFTEKVANRVANSRLGDRDDHKLNTLDEGDEVFYDRDPELFRVILNTVRYGYLNVPPNFGMELVQDELDFWRIPYETSTIKTEDEEELDADFDPYDTDLDPPPPDASAWRKGTFAAWCFMTDPRGVHTHYSTASLCYAIFILLITFLYMVFFGMSTSFQFRQPIINITSNTTCATKIDCFVQTETVPWLKIILAIVRTLFLLETIVRIVVCPSKKDYFASVVNWIDLTASICSIVSVCFVFIEFGSDRRSFAYLHIALDVFQVLRLFRVFQYMKLLDGLLVMMLTLKASIQELSVLLLYLLMGMFLWSSLIVLAELDVALDAGIPDCLIGYWWAIITMTTVGYGDYYPETTASYFIGVLTALFGLMMTALPVAVIGNNFTRYWEHMKKRRMRKAAQRQRRKALSRNSVSETNL